MKPLNLWQAFLQAAARTPARTALIFANRQLNYRDLMALVLRAAAFLKAHGVRRGDVVMLHMPKAVETYALLLGCLRLGATHCCMDVQNPGERTHNMLDRVRPRLLCTCDGELNNDHGGTVRVTLAVGGVTDAWPEPLAELPEFVTHGSEPAYVMFTSGSTGEPKGAVMPHSGILSLMAWAEEMFGPPETRRHSGLNPLHFDNSIFDVYCGLVSGAGLAPVETANHPPSDWVSALNAGGATVCFAVPTLFMLLDDLALLTPTHLPQIKAFSFGGEGFPVDRLRTFRERFRDQSRLINVYGPTETSCICSSLELSDDELAASEALPSLGRMHDNFDYAVLDDEQKPVPSGTAGELWIGGPCVGLGYYGNPEKTAERFFQDPRQDRYRSFFYRTGDIVREEQDGKLWFVGRADNQVKVAGHRIELEEIDFAVQALEGVQRASAVVRRGGAAPELCVAFAAIRPFTMQEILNGCRARLPHYMIPSRIVQLDELPRNANGKVDRLAITGLFEGQIPRDKGRAAGGVASGDVQDIERKLVEIWSAILGTPTVTVHDNFFDLGGTSMMMIRAHAEIQQKIRPELELVTMFAHPKISELASYLYDDDSSDSAAARLSETQERAKRQGDVLRRMRRARGVDL